MGNSYMRKTIGDLRRAGVSNLIRLLENAPEILMNEDLAKKLGEQIRTLRKKNGLTQAELGDTVGLTQGHVSDLENGLGWPKPETLVALSTALGVEVWELFAPIGSLKSKELEIPLKKAINRVFRGLKNGEITIDESVKPKIGVKRKPPGQ